MIENRDQPYWAEQFGTTSGVFTIALAGLIFLLLVVIFVNPDWLFVYSEVILIFYLVSNIFILVNVFVEGIISSAGAL